jgi:S1-C subfamily serine protease
MFRLLLCAAVFVVKVDPNYAQPWQKCPQRSSSGSAFVLDTEQRIIITNAHVVGARKVCAAC